MEYRIKKLIQRKGRSFPYFMFHISYSAQRGFTLIETMVAIAILLVAVTGPITLIGNSLGQIYFARDQVIAVNLAQEAIEVVRQKRDTNFLANAQWDRDFGNGDCANNGYQCLVDINPLNIIKCNGTCGINDNTRIYNNPSDALYHQYASNPVGNPINFKRVMFTNRVNSDEYAVTVNVTWNTGSRPGSITVSESIFNWARP